MTEAGRRRPRSPSRRCHWHEGRAELGRRQRGHASHLGGLAPLAAAGDFASVDPDEPAAHGRIVAVRAHGHGSAAPVRLMAVENGRSVLRTANLARPDIAVTRANETRARAVVVFAGQAA